MGRDGQVADARAETRPVMATEPQNAALSGASAKWWRLARPPDVGGSGGGVNTTAKRRARRGARVEPSNTKPA